MNNIKYKHNSEIVKSCQICNSNSLFKVLSMGNHPTVNDFLDLKEERSFIETYPLELFFCSNCLLVQLGRIIDPKKIFPNNYAYRSGTTKLLIDNFRELADEAINNLPLEKNDFVVDIGSNDGTLLSNFKKKEMRVLGVEPTDVAKIAINAGIDTINQPFNKIIAEHIKISYGKAKLITAANVFGHIKDVHDVMEGICNLLDHDGVFVSENHYLMSFIETLQYDTVYHEHLRYYSLRSLNALFDIHGLEIFDVKKIRTHGGSVRVFASRKGLRNKTLESLNLIGKEPEKDAHLQILKNFEKRTNASKIDLILGLYNLKKTGKRIVGIGAPSRASTLINYLGLDVDVIDYICEVENSLKLDKFMPGTKIPVVLEKRLFEEQPDYAILFSWHIASDLVPKIKQLGFKGKIIIPLPNFTVV
jgi:hypothetical protein